MADIVFKDAVASKIINTIIPNYDDGYNRFTESVGNLKVLNGLHYQNLRSIEGYRWFLKEDYPEIYRLIFGQDNGEKDVEIKSIQFRQTSVEWGLEDNCLKNGELIINPSNATSQEIIYTSSDPSVVTHNVFGFTVHKTGKAVVTAKAVSNSMTAKLNVTVVAGSGKDGMKLEYEEPTSEIKIGNTFKIDLLTYMVTSMSTVTVSSGEYSATSIIIPNNVCYKGRLFSVTSISDYAFQYFDSLTSVTIGNNVTSIGDGAFVYCSSLTSVNVDSDNVNYSSTNGVLFNKNKTELIYYPAGNKNTSYTIPNSVISIGDGAFDSCSSLTSVTIPNSVISIGGFSNCSSLTSIEIPNGVTSIRDYAFYSCSSLTIVTIPNSVTSIGYSAFMNCSSLTSVTIPNSVTSIGDCAFYGCSSLTSVTIPNSVTSIGYYAFGYYYYYYKIDGFTIIGAKGSVAESYANNHGFNFVGISIIEVTGISLSKTALTLEKGKQKTLTATVTPTDATDKTVKWSTSNSSVAVVNSNGKITAKAVGTATITAKTINGKKATCKVTVKSVPESVTLNKTSATLGVKQTCTLTASVNPTDCVTEYSWTSNNIAVATVNSTGKVTAKKVGTATITVKTSNGKTAACEVTVKKAPESVALNKTSATLGVKQTCTLTATLSPDNSATYCTWTSSDKTIATVTSAGKVTAKKVGTATITVKTSNGKTATCIITVKKAPDSIALNKTKTTINKGQTETLKATLSPTNSATYCSWSSSDKTIASVNSNGVVTAKKKGTATITVKTSNGKLATCTVTVK